MRGVKRYPDKKGETFLSTAQIKRLGAVLKEAERDGANDAAVAIIRLLAFTGARKTEIASLRWSEVDFEKGYLRLGDSKTGAKAIPIGPPAMKILGSQKRIHGTPFVFPAQSGRSHFQGVDKTWCKVRAEADFPFLRLHDLRHSFASTGMARGDGLAVIGAILGHADIKTTSRYAHLADDPVRRSAHAISNTISAALQGRKKAKIVKLPRQRRA